VLLTLPEVMQFGKVLWRILSAIVCSKPCLGLVYLFKVDISDDFYCMWVKVADVSKLGVMLLYQKGEERLISFPVVLLMGWKKSPPIFTSATNMVDLTNDRITEGTNQQHHHLDK
jgi:hypothetical protein